MSNLGLVAHSIRYQEGIDLAVGREKAQELLASVGLNECGDEVKAAMDELEVGPIILVREELVRIVEHAKDIERNGGAPLKDPATEKEKMGCQKSRMEELPGFDLLGLWQRWFPFLS